MRRVPLLLETLLVIAVPCRGQGSKYTAAPTYVTPAPSAAVGAGTDAPLPDIVIHVLDDVGYADLGFQGSPFPTPRLDAAAASGLVLDRFYATPLCAPSRCAIQAGRYPWRTSTHMWAPLPIGSAAALPLDVETLAEALPTAYAKHFVGKWHNGMASFANWAVNRGYDSFLGGNGAEVDYYRATFDTVRLYDDQPRSPRDPAGGPPRGAALDFFDGTDPLELNATDYVADLVLARALDVISDPSGRGDAATPLFLSYNDYLLHTPIQAPPEPEYLERCAGLVDAGPIIEQTGDASLNRTVFCAMTARMDDAFGALVDALHDEETPHSEFPCRWDNTLYWVLSDNGGLPARPPSAGRGRLNSVSLNGELRAGKRTLFEGGVRVVSFLTGGLLPAAATGRRATALFHVVDVFPTVMALARVPVNDDVDGVDIWPALAAGDLDIAAPAFVRDAAGAWHDASVTTPANTNADATAITPSFAVSHRNELPLYVAVEPFTAPYEEPADDAALCNSTAHADCLTSSAIIAWPFKLMVGEPESRFDGYSDADGLYVERLVDPFVWQGSVVRLYDIDADPNERHNLAADHLDIVANLAARLQAVRLAGLAPMQSTARPPEGNPRFTDWIWMPFLDDDNATAVVPVGHTA